MEQNFQLFKEIVDKIKKPNIWLLFFSQKLLNLFSWNP
jgi:hypothetical protein